MNTITANDKNTSLHCGSRRNGRSETGSAGQRAGTYLINQYKMVFLSLKQLAAFTKSPYFILNAEMRIYPIRENIWAFIEGSETR
jgi:hypothetical protein